MPVPKFDEWPTCDSELLCGIVDALRSRSKSLNNRVNGFSIEIIPDSDEPHLARLNLELRNWKPNPDRVSFTFWDDGAMRLDARRASKSGWDYEFSLAGCCRKIDPHHIRDMIEDSLWIECPNKMRDLWSACELQPE